MDRNLFLAIALSFLVLSLWTMTQPTPPKRLPPRGDTGSRYAQRDSDTRRARAVLPSGTRAIDVGPGGGAALYSRRGTERGRADRGFQ